MPTETDVAPYGVKFVLTLESGLSQILAGEDDSYELAPFERLALGGVDGGPSAERTPCLGSRTSATGCRRSTGRTTTRRSTRCCRSAATTSRSSPGTRAPVRFTSTQRRRLARRPVRDAGLGAAAAPDSRARRPARATRSSCERSGARARSR